MKNKKLGPKISQKLEESSIADLNLDDQHESLPQDKPPSIFEQLPREIVINILAQVAINWPTKLIDVILIGNVFRFNYDDALFWEPICRQLYPELRNRSKIDGTDSLIDAKRYGSYYNLFKKRPTVRTNGVYVCTSKYYRDGETTGISFYRPKHEVRYYRYMWLREDGTARSLLSNFPPKRILNLEPGVSIPSLKDAMCGNWSLDQETRVLDIVINGTERNYDFYFSFEIASSGGKVHNKLKWKKYSCIEQKGARLETEISLNNEGSYFFYRLDDPESVFKD
ncbi:SCF ubiquitin ligase complex subunit [Starmerella bacillaris]|uniref:SCF ubiquitin ligase complex subunit n=1 Tax=Starmerella bacillaris TaxID=1247836 RepID=A0AAV5RCC4_STABA|nr:SCF ubiquitin ligase complex subunit [Starmerella bacillaris]